MGVTQYRSPDSTLSIGGIKKSLFLAGGITGCPDWQAILVDLLYGANLVIYNPRRIDFPMNNPLVARDQIEWEYHRLKFVDAIAFWFPEETLCPITLYELGAWSKSSKPLFVGVHSNYKRKLDVEVQLSLARPEIQITDSLAVLSDQIRQWSTQDDYFN